MSDPRYLSALTSHNLLLTLLTAHTDLAFLESKQAAPTPGLCLACSPSSICIFSEMSFWKLLLILIPLTFLSFFPIAPTFKVQHNCLLSVSNNHILNSTRHVFCPFRSLLYPHRLKQQHIGTWVVVEWMSDFKSLRSFPLHYIPSISTCLMTDTWRTLESLIPRGDIGHSGEDTYLPAVMVLLLEHSGSRHGIDHALARQLPCPQTVSITS